MFAKANILKQMSSNGKMLVQF
jgi:taurine---2-oxoglutarate transaminase